MKLEELHRPDRFPRERFLEFCKQLKILTKDEGMVPLQMLGTQKYVLDEICKGVDEGVTTFVILKARQLGMSTFFLALDLFWCFEYPGLLAAFATHSDASKEQFRNIIKTFSDGLPKNMKIPHTGENTNYMRLQNGSTITYLVAGTKAKKKGSLGRSGAYNYLHATETAFWGSEDDLNELRATLSIRYKHRLEIYESTANGFNHYQDMWEVGQGSRTRRCIFIGWWRNELYRFEKNHPFYGVFMPLGERSPLTRLERMRIGEVKKEHEYQIESEQLAWYRWKLQDECHGDQQKMDEMFPWMPDDAFVATGSRFFSNECLTEAMRRCRRIPYQPFRYSLSDVWTDIGVLVASRDRHDLKVFEEASPWGIYSIGCDPAYGSSDTSDRTVVSVFRCFADKCYQVAEFVSNVTPTYQSAWVLAHLAGYYSDCMVNLEIQGPGDAVFHELNDLKRNMSNYNSLEAPGLKNCLSSFKHFLYKRTDAIGGQPT